MKTKPNQLHKNPAESGEYVLGGEDHVGKRISERKEGRTMSRGDFSVQDPSRRLSLVGTIVLVACASATGFAGLLTGRFAEDNILWASLSAVAGGAVVIVGLLQYRRAVAGTFGPMRSAESRVLQAIDAGELDMDSIGCNGNTGSLSLPQLVDMLRTTAVKAERVGGELEFANKVLLRDRRHVLSAIDSVGTGILALGPGRHALFANRAAQPFLEVSARDVAGKPIDECVTDHRVLEMLSEPEGGSGAAVGRIEMSLSAETSRAVYSVIANKVTESNGDVIGKCIQFEDVTDAKRAEKAREEFVNNVAHEMRTPLTSIKAYVEMLIDGEATDKDAQYEFYNIIYEETDRMNRLINNLLNISRMEMGELTVNRTPTRMKKLVEGSIAVVKSQMEKKAISLSVDLPDRLPAVEVDKDLLTVVFVNLMSNAAKYTPENGQISVTSTSVSDEILVHVTDTGMGIAESDQSRVFDKFYRCGNAEDSEITGSGLGLCLARQIMRLHGGDIRLSSVLGEGSQFSVVIPRSAIVTSLGDYEHE